MVLKTEFIWNESIIYKLSQFKKNKKLGGQIFLNKYFYSTRMHYINQKWQ